MNRIEKYDLYKIPPRWLFLKFDLIKNSELFKIANGYIQPPGGQGLEIELEAEIIKKATKLSQYWHHPVWRNEDESDREW